LLLSATFTVHAYDRRGRGASGDTPPYAVAREVEDLAAVIVEAGGTAFVHGMSSGGALTLKAAASGLAIGKLSLYEPPFSVDGDAEKRARAYAQALAGLLTEGRRGDAAALFMSHVGMPSAMVQGMRGAPMWPALEAMAPTLAYDSAVMGDETGAAVPAGLIAGVEVPCLVIGGGASPGWMRTIGQTVADALPNGSYTVLAGQTHDVSIEALAPVLRDFFAG
jgi:pimeloyl-ACP methyl ester carboxylesterase